MSSDANFAIYFQTTEHSSDTILAEFLLTLTSIHLVFHANLPSIFLITLRILSKF